jgi:hypothetical protein
MPTFKVQLVVPVKLSATLEFKMEAETEDAAFELAIDTYKQRDSEYQERLKTYHRTHKGDYPEAPFYWSVDSDDIEANLDEGEIEIDNVKRADDE